jgi:hypothetical protein
VVADSDYAKFIVSQDLNEIKNIMKEYDPDYITADSGYFSRYLSFGSYAYMTVDYTNPEISKFFSIRMSCQKVNNNGQKMFKCGQNLLLEDEYYDISTEWQNKPSTVINNQPIYIYRGKNVDEIILLNTEANNTIFAKIWFGHESVKDMFSITYQSGNVRVYKVHMDKII